MPGLDGAPHHNWRRLLRAAPEAEYGIPPVEPDWQVLPILGDGFKLLGTAPRFRPETNVRGHDRNIALWTHQELAGQHTCLAWPDAAEFLFGAALLRDATNQDLTSYHLDYFTPPDPRRIKGAVVEVLEVRVTGTGDSDVQLMTTWRARKEIPFPGLNEKEDFPWPPCVPFLFKDAQLWIGGTESIDCEAFTMRVTNALSVGPHVGGYISYCIAGDRTIELELTRANLTEELRAAIRDDADLQFLAEFTHPLGDIWTFRLPILAVEESDETASRTELSKENPRMIASNCDGDDIEYSFGAVTTTPSGI